MKSAGKVKTVDDALKLPAPTLGTFQRVKGRNFVEGYVSLWLIYLNEMLNLNKPLTEDQIELCATRVAEEFYMLKVTDFTLLFKRIISGEFGEFYESLSIAKVLTFFREYLETRFDTAAAQSLQAHKDRQSDDSFNITTNIERIYRGKSKGVHSKKK